MIKHRQKWKRIGGNYIQGQHEGKVCVDPQSIRGGQVGAQVNAIADAKGRRWKREIRPNIMIKRKQKGITKRNQINENIWKQENTNKILIKLIFK